MLKKLRAQYQKILARMKELSNATLTGEQVRSFTEAEQSEYDGLKAQSAEVKTAIDRLLEEDEASSFDSSLDNSRGAPAASISVTRERNCTEEGEYRGFKTLGEQLSCILIEKRGGHKDPRLEEMKQMRAAAGLNETVDTEGGFLVQSDFAADLTGASYENSQLTQYCTETEIGATSNRFTETFLSESSREDGSRNGGAVATWEGEAAQATISKPKLDQEEFKLKKLMALVPLTDELLEDTTALASEVLRIYGEEIGFQKDRAIIEGTGVGMPRGIIGHPSLVEVSKKSGQSNDTVVAENVESIWSRVLSRSKGTGIWLINPEVQAQLGLMTVGNYPVFTPPQGLKEAPYGLLKGRPIVECEHCNKLGDSGDIIFADLKRYRWLKKGGLKAATSIHVYFDSAQTALRLVERAMGYPMLRSAITPKKGTSGVKYSSFVTVEGR